MQKFKVGDKIIYKKGTKYEDFGTVIPTPSGRMCDINEVWAHWENGKIDQCVSEYNCELDTSQNYKMTIDVNVTSNLKDFAVTYVPHMEELFKQLNEAIECRDKTNKEVDAITAKIALAFLKGLK